MILWPMTFWPMTYDLWHLTFEIWPLFQPERIKVLYWKQKQQCHGADQFPTLIMDGLTSGAFCQAYGLPCLEYPDHVKVGNWRRRCNLIEVKVNRIEWALIFILHVDLHELCELFILRRCLICFFRFLLSPFLFFLFNYIYISLYISIYVCLSSSCHAVI